jgi:hypothetical protein
VEAARVVARVGVRALAGFDVALTGSSFHCFENRPPIRMTLRIGGLV